MAPTHLNEYDMSHDRTTWGPEEVATYLYFGYLPLLPEPRGSLPGWGLQGDERVEQCSHDELVSLGIKTFTAAFDDLPDGPHIVPLSGGLDSRAILAELCRRIPPDSVTAITVGVSGSLDYELSVEIARVAGVRHRRIDLGQCQLDAEQLKAAAQGNDAPTWLFDAHYNRLMRQYFGSDVVYWSGYLGSRLSSTKHLATDPQITFEQALARFVEVNRWSRTAQLTPSGADLRSCLPDRPLADTSFLGHDEQLDLWIRQQNLTRPVNLPAGYHHRAPFADPGVAAFLLSIPRSDGRRQRVYRDMLLRTYPKLFSLPTTANAGLALQPSRSSKLLWYVRRGLRAARRRTLPSGPDVWQANYLDLGHALRQRSDYRDLARGRLGSLVDRDVVPWLDIERLWNEHQGREANHALALTLLVSLDIHLDVAARAS